jgi:UDP:flavonoid glycosyltransferase YjiC (YdhE family)
MRRLVSAYAIVVVMFLFVPYSVAGHVYPMLPVLSELARRGNRLRVIVGERFEPAMRAAGAEVVRLAEVPEVVVPERMSGRFSARFLAGRLRRLEMNRQAGLLLDRELRQLGGRGVVVVDPMLGWADRVVRRHRVPTAIFSTTFHLGADALAELARQDGLPTPGWVHRMRPLVRRYERSGRLILANSMAELHPAGQAPPRDVHLVGPLLRPRDEANTIPEPVGDRVLFVSPGTVFARGQSFFDRFVRAFTGRPWQVYLATGHLDPADLGPLPSNVVAQRFLPQLQLLARSDVFVTHAGMNSVLEGLSAGVPMLLFPRSAEQRHLARCLVAGGVGVWPRSGSSDPDALFGLVDALAADHAVRAAAREWQARVDAGGPRRAADLLEAWALAQPSYRTGSSTDPSASSPAV